MKRFVGSQNSICRLQSCLYVNCIDKNARTFSVRTSAVDVKCNEKFGSVNSPIFKPSRAAILSRITRYEFEKLRYKGISEEGLKEKVSINLWSGIKAKVRAELLS